MPGLTASSVHRLSAKPPIWGWGNPRFMPVGLLCARACVFALFVSPSNLSNILSRGWQHLLPTYILRMLVLLRSQRRVTSIPFVG